MLSRIGVIALNTYREAVRARILIGLFVLSLLTAGYALVVATYASRSALRIVSDLTTLGMSLYAVLVAVVMGASSLYRELEQKTIFPILARPIRRWEYLLGKVMGTLLTLLVFLLGSAGVGFVCLAIKERDSFLPGLALIGSFGVFAAGIKLQRVRSWLPMVWAGLVFSAGLIWASGAAVDRRVILVALVLSWLEVAIVVAVAMVFSAFSSPFLTAVLTTWVFLVGRSADTLAKLPERVFGPAVHELGVVLSKVFPNLMVYVPPRPLLAGEVAAPSLGYYLSLAAVQSAAWVVLLLAVAAMLFRRRDFT